jgi:hypothetical protein
MRDAGVGCSVCVNGGAKVWLTARNFLLSILRKEACVLGRHVFVQRAPIVCVQARVRHDVRPNCKGSGYSLASRSYDCITMNKREADVEAYGTPT